MTRRAVPPIDESRLDHLSGGDEQQKVEMLALFAVEAPRLLNQAAAAQVGEPRRGRLAGLARLARNIGAGDLAERAERAAAGAADAAELSAVHAALDTVIAYIGTSSGRDAT